jgi:hypothetical protein
MKRLVTVFGLLALLAAPAPAAAKGSTSVEICGSDGCKNFGSATQLGGYGGGATGAMPAPAPFYELRFTTRAHGQSHTWTTWYVPSAKLFAAIDDREGVYWMPLDKPELAWAAKQLKPFPAPEITAVTIGSRRVTDDPASYLGLLTVETTDRNANPHGLADWEPVTFVSKQPSPWTLGQSGLQFSASRGVLQRGVDLVKLPDEMAADLRGGRPLGDEPAFPWRNVLLAVLGAAALLPAVGSIRPLRRRFIVRRASTTA